MSATQTFGPEMGIIDLIASVTSSLAWPGLIGFSIYTYRKPIAKLLVGTARMIRRMNSFKWGEFEMANRAVRDAKEAVEEKADAVEEQISEAPPDQVASLVRELSELKLQAARLEAAQSALVAAKNSPPSEVASDPIHSNARNERLQRSARAGQVIRAMVTRLGGPERVLNMGSPELRAAITTDLEGLDIGQAIDLRADELLDEAYLPTARLIGRTRTNARIMLDRIDGERRRDAGQ